MLELIGIKVPDGYYITDVKVTSSYHYSGRLTEYLVNGEKLERSFHKAWFKIDSVPTRVEKLVNVGYINQRYELRDKGLSYKFKEVYLREEVFMGYDGDDDPIFIPEFKDRKSVV